MSSEEKPKIIVDDDWKSRVQAEKESLKAGTGGDAAAEGKTSPEPQSAGTQPRDPLPEELPPASFDSLVSLLVTQALAALGQIPINDKQEAVVMLDHAKHYIDLLGVVEEKTAGNRSAIESEMLTRVLHELRMVFVAVQNRAASKSSTPSQSSSRIKTTDK